MRIKAGYIISKEALIKLTDVIEGINYLKKKIVEVFIEELLARNLINIIPVERENSVEFISNLCVIKEEDKLKILDNLTDIYNLGGHNIKVKVLEITNKLQE